MSLIWVLFALLAPMGLMWLIHAMVSLYMGHDPFHYLRTPVWLQESDGTWRKSRIHTDKNGVRWAPIYPASMTGHVVLNKGGIASGDSSYIKRWSEEEPTTEGRIELLNKKYKLN